MQRPEPCLEPHMHKISCAYFKSHYGPVSIPNDLHTKTNSTVSKTVYFRLKQTVSKTDLRVVLLTTTCMQIPCASEHGIVTGQDHKVKHIV